MHSSRICTARFSGRPRGGGGPGCVYVCPGGCLPRVVAVCVQRVSAQGGVTGGVCQGVCVCVQGGVQPPDPEADTTPPPRPLHAGIHTLPCEQNDRQV